MIKALIVNNRKGWCLFRVERTKAGMPTSLAHKFYPLADDIGQRNTLTQIFDEFRWYGHNSPVSQPPKAHS
jgi:hypothetical protein